MCPSFLFFLFAISSLASLDHAAFLTPIQKDHTYRQYSTPILLKTPLQPVKLFFDLGGTMTWLNCYSDYTSSTYQHIPCNTPLYDSFGVLDCERCIDEPPSPTCSNVDICYYYVENTITRRVNLDVMFIDYLALTTTNGSNQGSLYTINNYIFSCAPATLLKGLPETVIGMAAFGRSNISLRGQATSTISAPSYFAVCLSGSRNKPGFGFIGSSGPYIFTPGIDVSKSLTYSPLVINPIGDTPYPYDTPPSEYFIGLNSIKINGKVVPFNKTLLLIDKETGRGGTKVSTIATYTTMQRSIYKAFITAFIEEASAMNLTLAKPVVPFEFCYSAEGVSITTAGPEFPTIDLALEGNVNWRIYGANSMVKTISNGKYFWCLGFLDGGVEPPRTSIVIGGYQMEDNLLQFDLQSNRLGFSSSLLLKGTTCANFDFNSANYKP